MNLDELTAEFDRMELEPFRLQQHQSYAGVEGPEWEAWQAGKPLPVITPDNHPWLKRVAGYTAAGKRVYDVHIVEWSLAEYTRYALALIPMEMSDGSEYFLVDRDAHPELATLTEDFWMFDEKRVAVMHYDEQERFVVAGDPTESIETYVARRDLAMKYAVPFEQWVSHVRCAGPAMNPSAARPLARRHRRRAQKLLMTYVDQRELGLEHAVPPQERVAEHQELLSG